MRNKKYNQFFLILLFVITSFYPVKSRTQGICLEKGEKGLSILGGFSFNKNSQVAGVAFGFSIGSTLDAGISYSKGVIDATNERFTDISPSVSIYLINRTDDIPFSLGLFYSYEIINFNRDNYIKGDVTSYANSYGAFILCKFGMATKSRFIPEIGIIHSELDEGTYLTNEKYVNSIIIGFNLCSGYQDYIVPIVNPDIVINKDNITFGISLGFVFPSEK